MGGIEKDLLKTIENILAYEIRLPGWGSILRSQVVPLWALAVDFTIVYSILYAIVVTEINIFKTKEGRKAANAFAIAVSLFVILGTKLPTFTYKLFNMWVGLIVLVLVGLTFWFLYFKVWQYGIKIKRVSKESIHEDEEALKALDKENKSVDRDLNVLQRELSSLEKKDVIFEKKVESLIEALKSLKGLEKDPAKYKRISKEIINIIKHLEGLKKRGKEHEKINKYLNELIKLEESYRGLENEITKDVNAVVIGDDLKKKFNSTLSEFSSFRESFIKQLGEVENILITNNDKIMGLLEKVSRSIDLGYIDKAIDDLKEIQGLERVNMTNIEKLKEGIRKLEKYSKFSNAINNKLETTLKKEEK